MYRSWELHCTPEATQRHYREKRETQRAHAWGSAFIGVEGEDLRSSKLTIGEFQALEEREGKKNGEPKWPGI